MNRDWKLDEVLSLRCEEIPGGGEFDHNNCDRTFCESWFIYLESGFSSKQFC